MHLLLFVLTLLTTTWAGALHAGVNLSRKGRSVGLPYSLGLMLILGPRTRPLLHRTPPWGQGYPPYFIPAPFALGTFGAFIDQVALADRRATFDVAVAATGRPGFEYRRC